MGTTPVYFQKKGYFQPPILRLAVHFFLEPDNKYSDHRGSVFLDSELCAGSQIQNNLLLQKDFGFLGFVQCILFLNQSDAGHKWGSLTGIIFYSHCHRKYDGHWLHQQEIHRPCFQ